MKRILLIPCIFFALLTTANAEDLYTCTDSNGNTVIASTPQEGLKCVSGKSNEEPNEKPKSRKISSKKNLVDTCNDLFSELDNIGDEITELEKHRSELQREQLNIRQEGLAKNWDYRRQWQEMKPVNDKINKLYNESSILSQKKYLIDQDIRLNKCYELKNDLSRLNQKTYEPNYNKNKRYKNQ
jgi:Domain of unknown function (DUF4124)